MSARTSLVLTALGDDEALEVILLLLMGPKTIGELVFKSGLPQPTVSRRVSDLRLAGLVRPDRRKAAIALTDPRRIRALLLRANDVARRSLDADQTLEAAYRTRIP